MRRALGAYLAGRRPPAREPGLFVALRLEPSDAAALAASAEVPARSLHVTLAFLGKLRALPPGAWGRAARALARVAPHAAPLRASLGPPEVLPGGAERAVVAPVDAEGLADLRARVVEALDAEGLAVDDTWPFVPHLTLGRTRAGARWRARWRRPDPPPGPYALGALWLCLGPTMEPFPLGG